jgi:N6-L-threonylcarbamoyladenine synthase
MIHILGIESSCDDTAAAICTDGKIRSNVISSQLDHAQFGGVIPELASRLHMRYIVPVVESALQQANIHKSDLSAIAFTAGPGLLGSLLVGSSFAKGLATALNIPIIAVDHLQGHLLSLWIEPPLPTFPMLVLTVSGGHTSLTIVQEGFQTEIIGRTRDDAAGEAFDKIGKLMGLPYPAGPQIDKMAQLGYPHFHAFPVPQLPSWDFSFSGLKTSFLYYLKAQSNLHPDFLNYHRADLCASIQYRIVQYLLDRLFAAAKAYNIQQLGIVGGVSANSYLRQEFAARCQALGYTGIIPKIAYSTDNAAMIALGGYFRYLKGDFDPHTLVAYANAHE